MVSLTLMATVMLSFIGTFIQSRRTTEASVLHAACTSVVYGIVEQAGGFLLVDSDVGAGTRVSVHLPRADRDYAIEVGLRMLTLRHLVREEAGLYRAHEGELPVLRYYALSIAHLCPPADARRAGGADTAPAWPEAA